MINNKRIFITGGAGFLGKSLISKYYDNNEIIVYSRDEAKHYYLKKKFPKIKTIIGDVRNYELMLKSSIGSNIGIFTASLKQIDSVNYNVSEANRIIIDGAINSKNISIENKFDSACFISSDKSRSATTIYGAMKFVAGESFIINAEDYSTKLSTAIYGNVLNSTGSIIPLMWDAIYNKYELTLYSKDMTRFVIDIDAALFVIEHALNVSGYNVIPNMKSMRVYDLFKIFSEKFGLRYNIGVPRISEKLHEMVISSEESVRTKYDSDLNLYFMHYNDILNENNFEYNSSHNIMSIVELDSFLSKYNYFKPI